jgi:hypothetical protein
MSAEILIREFRELARIKLRRTGWDRAGPGTQMTNEIPGVQAVVVRQGIADSR